MVVSRLIGIPPVFVKRGYNGADPDVSGVNNPRPRARTPGASDVGELLHKRNSTAIADQRLPFQFANVIIDVGMAPLARRDTDCLPTAH